MTTTAPTTAPFRYPLDLLTAARRDPRLRGQEAAKDVLGEIVEHGASRGHCFLTDERLAALTGRHPGTIKRAVRLLQGLGCYLSRVIRGKHKGMATVYILPLAQDGIPKGSAAAPSPEPDGPQRGAQPFPKGSAAVPKGERNCAPPTSYGTHDLTHHDHDPDGVDGDGSRETGRGPGAVTPGPSGSVLEWVDHAMDVAAGSGSGSGRTREAVCAASGAIVGRLSSDSPAVIARPLWEAIRGSEADRERLRTAATVADQNLRMGAAPSEVGRTFGGILKGTARPLYKPAPGSEAAEVARRPEPGSGRRRDRRSEATSGGLTELARELADRPAEVMGFAVGRPPEGPPLPPPAPPVNPRMSEAEAKRKSRGGWDRLRATLPPEPEGRPS